MINIIIEFQSIFERTIQFSFIFSTLISNKSIFIPWQRERKKDLPTTGEYQTQTDDWFENSFFSSTDDQFNPV